MAHNHGRLDYENLPNQNNPFPGESPAEYERRLERTKQTAQSTFYSGAVQKCSKNKHFPGKVVFACDHCETQDPVHPNGIIFSPFKYFLCMRCYQNHMVRKLDLAHILKTRCFQCITDEIARIKAINPSLVKDFTTEKL